MFLFFKKAIFMICNNFQTFYRIFIFYCLIILTFLIKGDTLLNVNISLHYNYCIYVCDAVLCILSKTLLIISLTGQNDYVPMYQLQYEFLQYYDYPQPLVIIFVHYCSLCNIHCVLALSIDCHIDQPTG